MAAPEGGVLSTRGPGFQLALPGKVHIFGEGKVQADKHSVCPFSAKRRFVMLLEPDCIDYPLRVKNGFCVRGIVLLRKIKARCHAIQVSFFKKNHVIPYLVKNYVIWGVEDSNLRRLSQQIYRRIVVALSPCTVLCDAI
jgi:hypothetical protein